MLFMKTLDENPLVMEPRINFTSLAEPSQRPHIRMFIIFLAAT
jgi:hypothetical protein